MREKHEIDLSQHLIDRDNQRAFENTYSDEYEELDQIEAEIQRMDESESGDESDEDVARYLKLSDRRVQLWRLLGV